jgi:hypothetical protein
MTMLIFLIGLCLGGVVTLVGVIIVVSVLTTTAPKDRHMALKQPYDDVINRFDAELSQTLQAFLYRLNQPQRGK